jgi:adenylate cyclase class 2
MEDQELEVKYYVKDLARVESQLWEMRAVLCQPRIYEINLRFDTPQGDLARAMRVLRLRQDSVTRLTYKGPPIAADMARLRQEIELEVSDFRAARVFLEALGYQVAMIYEKYRAVYDYQGVHIALDELPFGNFVEIEGPDVASLQIASINLGLNWAASVQESYVMLFERLKIEQGFDFRDLVFVNFQGLDITPEILKIMWADEEMGASGVSRPNAQPQL